MASYTKVGENKYRIFVELGYNEKGRRIRRTKTVIAKSERALKKAMTEFEIEVRKNAEELNTENITFKTFAERFIEMHVIPNLSIRTRDTYTNYLRNGIIDFFGDMKMNQIKAYHVVKFFKREKEEGRRGLTGKYTLLKSIFSKAVNWEIITQNPMDKVEPPEKNTRYRKIKFYTPEQLKQLFHVLDNERVYPKHRIIIKLAVLGGLRRSELLGLRIESFDFEKQGVLVDKQLHYDKNTKKFLLGPTKTKKPRFVHLPGKFMDEIKDYIFEQKKLKLRMGNLWQPITDENGEPINLIFTKENGKPTHINSICNEWRKIIKRYNLPKLNFHGLRHSHASYLILNGANLKTIQEQLGHEDMQETINTYSHITEEFKREEIKVFDKLIDWMVTFWSHHQSVTF